jgi:hypothetical protein
MTITQTLTLKLEAPNFAIFKNLKFGILAYFYFLSALSIPLLISILVLWAGSKLYQYLVSEDKVSLNDTDTNFIAYPCKTTEIDFNHDYNKIINFVDLREHEFEIPYIRD